MKFSSHLSFMEPNENSPDFSVNKTAIFFRGRKGVEEGEKERERDLEIRNREGERVREEKSKRE